MSHVSIIELTDSNTCKICMNALSKYSCPRCNIPYCSLKCYQSEGHVQCSENFYQDCVLEEMNVGKNDKNAKQKMFEILKRANQNQANEDENLDSDDDHEYLDLGDRLAGINLDDTEKVWEKLNDDEKQEFAAFLKSDDVSKIIPKWEPWWNYKCGKIQEVEQQNYRQKCPQVKENIPKFAEITRNAASDCVKYNVINVLAAYAFSARYFNGECFDFVQEAVATISSLSLNLKNNQNFIDFETAVKSVEQQCYNVTWVVIDEENIKTMRDDLFKILQGPEDSNRKFYMLSALSDIFNLFEAAKRRTNFSKSDGAFSKSFLEPHFPSVQMESSSKIKIYIKKIGYFLSFVNDCFCFE